MESVEFMVAQARAALMNVRILSKKNKRKEKKNGQIPDH